MAKSNAKSIRLSDKVLRYIENYVGTGFNEKFENIILYAMESEQQRDYTIKYLDEQIEDKRNQLKEYEIKICKIQNIDRMVSDIVIKMQLLEKQVDEL